MLKTEAVLRWVRETPLSEMAPVLTALADKAYHYRLTHNGYVPIEVFEQLLGPVTVSVQLVHEVVDADGKRIGFALRRREDGEAGEAYSGKFHNTCGSLRWLDDLESATARNDADAFAGSLHDEPKMIDVTLHHEAQRRNMDLTFMFLRRRPSGDIARMRGDWQLFPDREVNEASDLIIESNIHQLRWVMDEHRPWFGVLKESFPPELRG